MNFNWTINMNYNILVTSKIWETLKFSMYKLCIEVMLLYDKYSNIRIPVTVTLFAKLHCSFTHRFENSAEYVISSSQYSC